MKRLFKNIICAVLAPVALVSCMDLDENVYDKLPTDEFGTTEKQINAIMAPAYQSLKNMLAYDGPWGAADMTADILMAPTRVGGDWWDGGQYMEQCMHSWKPNSYSVENCWDYCTGGLTTVNSVYNIIEKSEAMSDELKLQYLSELRGLRAFWYYVIVDIFGNAPLVTDFEDTSLPSSTSRADIYKYVVKELTRSSRTCAPMYQMPATVSLRKVLPAWYWRRCTSTPRNGSVNRTGKVLWSNATRS